MKKLLLLPVLLFFAACSTDDNDKAAFSAKRTIISATSICNLGIQGFVYVDLASGLQNPVAVFTANIEGGSPKLVYRATVEVEMLSDCEDINSGNGTVLEFAMPGYVQNPSLNSPVVRIEGASLPAQGCYRWRFVIEGASGSTAKASCISTSDWYEAPLF